METRTTDEDAVLLMKTAGKLLTKSWDFNHSDLGNLFRLLFSQTEVFHIDELFAFFRKLFVEFNSADCSPAVKKLHGIFLRAAI